MLDPYFFRTPEGFEPSDDDSFTMKVIGYSAAGEYTLVVFAYGDEEEYSTIEALYRDRVLVAAGSGAIPLGVRGYSGSPRGSAGDPTIEGIKSEVGSNPYNIPLTIAKKLRSEQNFLSFLP
jgi:hypothetical protein